MILLQEEMAGALYATGLLVFMLTGVAIIVMAIMILARMRKAKKK